MEGQISVQIDELNSLINNIDKKGQAGIEKIIEILQHLKAEGFSLIKKSAWDFFRLNVMAASQENAHLYKQIALANNLTTSSFLNQNYEDAKKWREIRTKLELELETNILREKKNAPYFQLSREDEHRIEIRVSARKFDRHIELNAV